MNKIQFPMRRAFRLGARVLARFAMTRTGLAGIR